MDEKFDPEEFIDEADKHWTRHEQLEPIKHQLEEVESFDIYRTPRDGNDDMGVIKALEVLDVSQRHSRSLFECSIAAHIADDIGYDDQIQARKPNDTMNIIMWEPINDDTIRNRINDHGYATIVDEFDADGDTVYTLKIDFEGYYHSI
jgi:hypothetical protein